MSRPSSPSLSPTNRPFASPTRKAFRPTKWWTIACAGCWAFVLLSHCITVSRSQATDDYKDSDGDSDEWGANLEDHPDPNDEHHEGMVYIGQHDPQTGKRIGFDRDNGIRYVFGTSFDETHKSIAEADLLHHPLRPVHDIPEHEREQILKDRRHKSLQQKEDGSFAMPKAFGHVDEHPLDGGVVPPRVVHVDPFFLDATLVTNKEFGRFVRATYYETEAEKYGWSFVLETMVDKAALAEQAPHDELEADPEAQHWIAVDGAYWRRPEGPNSSYKYREDHPVVHVSHRDAAEYCKWVGKRLPGEWEYEAAARGKHTGPSNRTLFAWGDDDKDWELAAKHANLWGPGRFPTENDAPDGYRATSPVTHYPPNALGVHDTTGNVWEWMRGGKHKARIVRGASFVDSLDGSFNHAATLGARSTIHATTTTANVGFRCAKAPKRRTEFHYVTHDEATHGQLAIEDQFGKRDAIPQQGWEDQHHYVEEDDEDDDEDDPDGLYNNQIKKRRVVKKRERYSNEL